MIKERVTICKQYKGIESRTGVFYIALSYTSFSAVVRCFKRKGF